MLFLKKPDTFCFTSSDLDIVIDPQSSAALTFSIKMGDLVVLPEETFYRNTDGVIYITSIGDILTAWLRDNISIAYLLNMQNNIGEFSFIYNSSTIHTHTIMRCDVDFDMTAAAFCKTHFLSLIFGTKITASGRREFLAFYDTSAVTVSVLASYLQSGNIVTQNFTRTTTGTSVKYADVSPDLFAVAGKKLIHYTVTAGDRQQVFEIDQRQYTQLTHFVYRNCFGVEETFTCSGEMTSEGKYERYYATYSGGYKNYKRKNLREYTADTGILSECEAYALDDMFSSDEIWMYDSSGLIKEIVILDQSVKRSSLVSELPRFEFSFRLTQSNQRYKTALGGRIFDSTFDRSFE